MSPIKGQDFLQTSYKNYFKGWTTKRRGLVKILLMLILKYFTEKYNIFFDNNSVFFKQESWTHTKQFLFKKKSILPNKTFSVSEGAILNTLKLFTVKLKMRAGF